jgi:ribosomal protein L33
MAKSKNDNLIRIKSKGDKDGNGAGHMYTTRRKKYPNAPKFSVMKYNPIARKHTLYEEVKWKK